MALVTSGAWISEANERKKKRDEVRDRFRARIGIKPLKNHADLTLSPAAQRTVVDALVEKANPHGSADIQDGLASLKTALAFAGLGLGGAMANEGATSLDFGQLVPQQITQWHFGGSEHG
jgi:hypothetical protein